MFGKLFLVRFEGRKRVGRGLETFAPIKIMLGVGKERVVEATVTYGAQIRGWIRYAN